MHFQKGTYSLPHSLGWGMFQILLGGVLVEYSTVQTPLCSTKARSWSCWKPLLSVPLYQSANQVDLTRFTWSFHAFSGRAHWENAVPQAQPSFLFVSVITAPCVFPFYAAWVLTRAERWYYAWDSPGLWCEETLFLIKLTQLRSSVTVTKEQVTCSNTSDVINIIRLPRLHFRRQQHLL